MPRPTNWCADTDPKALDETVNALQAIEDIELEGYIAFVDSGGVMKGLFHKPIIARWEDSADA